MKIVARNTHPRRNQPDTGDDEPAEFCGRAGDVILLSEAAQQHSGGSPICQKCEHSEECTKLSEHLLSHH